MSALRFFVIGHTLFGPGKPTYVIEGGNDQLPKAFALRLSARIYYGSPVVQIVHGPERVKVVFRQPGASHVLEADRLICATPFTMFEQMEISPPFSMEKQEAVRQVRYESATVSFCK